MSWHMVDTVVTNTSCQHMKPLSERKYGRLIVKSLLIATFFGGAFVLVLIFSWPLLTAGDDALLAKIGTMTSIGGVFLGTYIAVWLINQNRTRNIKENYFYKVSFLVNVQEMLHAVYLISSGVEIELENIKEDEKKIKILQRSTERYFEYHQNQIEMINFNILVPADIRADVKLLLREGAKLITTPSENWVTQKSVVLKRLLLFLNKVIDSPYFASKRDKMIQKNLDRVIGERNHVEIFLMDSNPKSPWIRSNVF